MSFVDKCINDSLPLWDSFLSLPFLRELAEGSLDEARFMGYIVDDSLYLREYAKVFAWGMTKAQDMASIRTLYSLLSFINEGEGATRLQYLKRYGLTDDAIQPLPQRPENKAYTDYMIQGLPAGQRNSGVHDGEPALYAQLQPDLSADYILFPFCQRNALLVIGAGLCR